MDELGIPNEVVPTMQANEIVTFAMK